MSYLTMCVLLNSYKSPTKIVYGENTDAWNWFPLLFISYFHHHKYGPVNRSSTQSQTITVIAIGGNTNSNAMNLYNPVTISIYTNGYYALDTGHHNHNSTTFGLTYNEGIFIGTYIS